MALREQQQQQQSPSFLDALLCEEQHTFDDDDEEKATHATECHTINDDPLILFWEEDDELVSLISKERGETHLGSLDLHDGGTRVEGVAWISKVSAHFGFSALTTVLAVNYFDRFITSPRFQRDKPWMTQLSAVACLSLAAKVEETHVPLLLDLQV